MHFTHPLALWSLLALPVILLIHCLQERARKLRVSTLFLLDYVAPENVTGAKLERLRTSPPLWLQLLAACLITWMLSGPRWLREDSTQTVVVLLDSSASMAAFQPQTDRELQRVLTGWSKAAHRTHWHLLETDVRKPRLYSGSELATCLGALQTYAPQRGTHSLDEAYAVARGLLKQKKGAILLVSDHVQSVPTDVALLAVGEPLENVGFLGVETQLEGDATRWTAMVRHTGKVPQTRQWWLEPVEPAAAGDAPAPQKHSISLQPGQTLSLRGELPPSVQRARLVLEGDALKVDDALPLQRPLNRPLRVAVQLPEAGQKLLLRMLEAMPGVSMVKEEAPPDLTVAELGQTVAGAALLLGPAVSAQEKLETTPVVAEHHALTKELNWTGLLTQHPTAVTLTDADSPLLWKGDTALAWLHREGAATQLVLNWDLPKSNAHRVPAVLVLMQRYLELQRDLLPGERAGTYEIAQRLPLPTAGKAPLQLEQAGRTEPYLGRVPEQPGFFTVRSGKEVMVRGACYFADARETDLTLCSSQDGTERLRLDSAMQQSTADPLTPLWAVLVLGCLLGAWATERR
jgi:hypothetical protein